MPGTILRLLVNVGDTVQENQSLMILEAMKMENEIVAPKQEPWLPLQSMRATWSTQENC